MYRIVIFREKPIKEYTDLDEFEDAYEMVENSHTKTGDMLIDEYNKLKEVFSENTFYLALAMIRIWVFAVNGCDESFPNWDNGSEKRYPYWNMAGGGVGFSLLGALYGNSGTIVGSRLVLKDVPRVKFLSEHKNVKPLYKIIMFQ